MEAAEEVPVHEGARVAEHRLPLDAHHDRQTMIEGLDQNVGRLAPLHGIERSKA